MPIQPHNQIRCESDIITSADQFQHINSTLPAMLFGRSHTTPGIRSDLPFDMLNEIDRATMMAAAETFITTGLRKYNQGIYGRMMKRATSHIICPHSFK